MYEVSGELTTILNIIWWLQTKEILTASKQVAQNFDVERFNLRKLNELEGRKQYQIKASNRLAVLENVNDSEDIYRVGENIKESIKSSAKESLSLYELKQHKPWFDKTFLRFQIKGSRLKCSGYRIQTKEI